MGNGATGWRTLSSARTRACYLRCVRHSVRHFLRPPDPLTPEHIRQCPRDLTGDRQVSWPSVNQVVCAVRCFSRQGLKQDWAVAPILYQRTGRTRPEILSPQEGPALFRATLTLTHRAVLMTMEAGGLRASEVTHRRVPDIDSPRMGIRIEEGTGRRDRDVMLSPHLQRGLHEDGRGHPPTTRLFPHPAGRPRTRERVNGGSPQVRRRAEIPMRGSPYSLRHAGAPPAGERDPFDRRPERASLVPPTRSRSS